MLAAIFSSLALLLPPPTGHVSLVYSQGDCGRFACYTCDQPVALDELDIVIDTSTVHLDALKLNPGCTGYINTLHIDTMSADGIKGAEGAHDFTVNGGYIHATAKADVVHQDGMQIMGGLNETFRNLDIRVGRADDDLIDAEVFIKMGGSSTVPPTGIIVANSTLGPDAAHTVNLQTSVRSGVRSSYICPAKYPRLTFTVGPGAVNPVNRDNQVCAA
jgi:hypothetical protein